MEKENIILVADDDNNHFELIRKNLLRAGLRNKILHLSDGREVLDFLLDTDTGHEGQSDIQEYILLLDINISGIDGVEILEKIKQDEKLKRIPVIILTAKDDPHTIERCHILGCSTYIVKPAGHEDFEETVHKIGNFLSVVEITSAK
ncbi:MAG: response regulator [Planctomycetota bacterium]|jgi:CheY-like chemotaxis protein